MWRSNLVVVLLLAPTVTAQSPPRPVAAATFATLPEVLRLKMENLGLKDQALNRDLQIALEGIKYQARMTALQAEKAALEPSLISALGGDPATQTVDWETLVLIAKPTPPVAAKIGAVP